ncbi:MAG: magnesium transporter CorA family protein [Chitinispirillaceae bacterium]|jgi:magnesium transporter|nr:magnesium transporter CorA family protein [Chitinispirillaceae bacterium]
MVKHFAISEGRIVLSTGLDCQLFVYISPDDIERKYLLDVLKIDEHTLQSALDPNELGRVEFEPDHAAIIVKRPKRYSSQDNFLFKVESFGMFIWSDKLIILLSEDVPIFDGRQFSKIETLQDLVLKIIYRSVSHFEEHIKVISMIGDDLEQQINASMTNRQLLNMFTLEKSLVFYLDGISSNRRVIEKLKTNAAKFSFSTVNLEYLDDLAIENSQAHEMAQVYSQVISGLMDARASVISNNLNVMMKNLNALVIAVAVPSFFAGVGGMSEFTGYFGATHWILKYCGFVAFMVLIGFFTFFAIKKMERYWKES